MPRDLAHFNSFLEKGIFYIKTELYRGDKSLKIAEDLYNPILRNSLCSSICDTHVGNKTRIPPSLFSILDSSVTLLSKIYS